DASGLRKSPPKGSRTFRLPSPRAPPTPAATAHWTPGRGETMATTTNDGPALRPGDVHDVRRRLWDAVVAASAIADDPEADPALRLRGVHGVTQAAQAYMKVL